MLLRPPDSDENELQAYISTNLSSACFREFIESKSIYLLCAYKNEEMAGFVSVCVSSDCAINSDIAATSEIQKLYVLPKYHGTNVAKQLMVAAIKQLKIRGITAVWLGVYNENLHAKRFYSKFGFQVVSETEFQMGREVHLDNIMVAKIA